MLWQPKNEGLFEPQRYPCKPLMRLIHKLEEKMTSAEPTADEYAEDFSYNYYSFIKL